MTENFNCVIITFSLTRDARVAEKDN